VCSGLHATPVAGFDLRLTCGPDSAPGSFASRCGPLSLDSSDGSRFLTPGAVFAYATPLSPHGSWCDDLTARVLESTQSSGWVSSGQLIPLSAIGNGLLFVGPDRTPKFYGTWTDSAVA